MSTAQKTVSSEASLNAPPLCELAESRGYAFFAHAKVYHIVKGQNKWNRLAAWCGEELPGDTVLRNEPPLALRLCKSCEWQQHNTRI